MRSFNRDILNNLPNETVSKATFKLLTVHQDHPPAVQAASAAAMFLLLCEAFRVEPQDVFVAVKNALANDDSDKRSDGRSCYRAVRMYIENEIKK